METIKRKSIFVIVSHAIYSEMKLSYPFKQQNDNSSFILEKISLDPIFRGNKNTLLSTFDKGHYVTNATFREKCKKHVNISEFNDLQN